MKSPEQHNQQGDEAMKIKIAPDLEAAIQTAEITALISIRENREARINVPGFPGIVIGSPESMSARNGTFLASIEIIEEKLFVYKL